MLGPIVDVVAARVGRRALGLAGVAGGGLLLASLGLSMWLRPADAITAAAEAEIVPIVAVALEAGDDIVVQTDPQSTIVDHGHEPVDVLAVTIAQDGRRLRLVPRPGTVDIVGVGYPSDVDGVAVSENGARTPANTAGFDVAASRVLSSTDLRDYLVADDVAGVEWGHDLAVVFDQPLTSGQYLVVRERNGNSGLRLTPLDDSALPFATGRPIVLDPVDEWNTGYAPGDRTPAQPVHLTVVAVDALLAATTADGVEPSDTVRGLRIETDDGADVNLSVFVDEASDAARATPAPTIAGPDDAAAAALASAARSGPPSIAALGSIYVGHDRGAGCGAARTFAEAMPDQTVTYCVAVTNTGASTLADLTVAAPTLPDGFVALAASSAPLEPGETVTFFAEGSPPPDGADGEIDDTSVLTATATASASGTAVATEAVTASTDVVSFPPDPDDDRIAPAVALDVRTDDCDTDTPGPSDDGVAHCFTVTNTGNTHLDTIVITDPSLTGEPTGVDTSPPLPPGASTVVVVEAEAGRPATSGGETAAVVTANAVDDSGSDLVGVPDVSAAARATGAASADTSASAGDAHGAALGEIPAGATAGAMGETAAPQLAAPAELAFTGWETGVFAGVGLLLMAAGGLLLYPAQAERLRELAIGELGDPVRDYFDV